MFSKTRKPEEIIRYTHIIQRALEAGVNHPEVKLNTGGQALYSTNGISLVLMKFIDGNTFSRTRQSAGEPGTPSAARAGG